MEYSTSFTETRGKKVKQTARKEHFNTIYHPCINLADIFSHFNSLPIL